MSDRIVPPIQLPSPTAAPKPFTPPPVALPTGQVIPSNCSQGYIALTFDDGPSPAYTNTLVDYLIQARVPATFFVVGWKVAANPQPTQRAGLLGFTIGNHTWDHPQLLTLTDDQITAEIVRTQQIFQQIGIATGTLFRSPYGQDNPHIVSLINSLGLTPVGWTVDSLDYRDGNPDLIAARVLNGLKPHVFNQVLVHDGIDIPNPEGRVASAETLPAIPKIVDAARQAGYCFTQFRIDGAPAIPAPVWGPNGWVLPPQGRHR